MGKPFYSIGIIFKNEIRCLERCLSSLEKLRGSVPCEVVMADTGSGDGSRAVAEKYADILIDFPWVDDFAAARNAVMDRCSGVWYISIDADEWLDGDIQELVKFSRAKQSSFKFNFGGVRIRNYLAKPVAGGENYTDFLGVRIMRLSTGIRYEGCIHEHWVNEEGGRTLQTMSFSKTLFHHDGYLYETKADERAKCERNMALLRKKLAEDPDDIQTLLECVDSSKTFDGEASTAYVRRAIEGVRQKRRSWERFGPVVFRSAVCVASIQHLPELEQWIDEALEQFPDSIFTRVDVNYRAFAHHWTGKDYDAALRYGQAYLRGVDDYRNGRFDSSENIRGSLDNASPFWRGKVVTVLPYIYMQCGEPDKAFSAFRDITPEDLGNHSLVALCVETLLWLHRATELDTASLMRDFWEITAGPNPESEESRKRQALVLEASARSFTLSGMEEEEREEGFRRYSYTIYAALEGECILGDAAAFLLERDPARLEERLAGFEDLNEMPISVLFHALECGVSFPLPDRTLKVEEMDRLSMQLSREKKYLFPLARRAAQGEFTDSSQNLLWTRGLILAAVRTFDWEAEDADGPEGVELARQFARVEKKFLPAYYAAGILTEENLPFLPALHRFGFYCAQAFDALDAGDGAGYVRLLREGLSICEGMKDMVEFLLEHTPQLQTPPEPSEELKTLADQIRAVLANFSPDDPAVAALKGSEAYQKVAYLIEGMEVPVVGGLPS